MIFLEPRLVSRMQDYRFQQLEIKVSGSKTVSTPQDIRRRTGLRIGVPLVRGKAAPPSANQSTPCVPALAPPSSSPRLFESPGTHNTPEPARVGRGGVGGANGPNWITPPYPDSPRADTPLQLPPKTPQVHPHPRRSSAGGAPGTGRRVTQPSARHLLPSLPPNLPLT